jgi:predicted metalloprotease with PDZ domain
MRAMWVHHGRPGGDPVGTVAAPYTIDDVRARLGEVSGDAAFARAFIARYVQGREAPDYEALLAPAGLRLRKLAPGRATLGPLPLERHGSRLRIAGPVAPTTPLGEAGLGEDDEIAGVEDRQPATMEAIQRALQARRPGEFLALRIVRRDESMPRVVRVPVVEDPRVAIVPAESIGEAVTPAHRAFRDGWLRSRTSAPRASRFTIGPEKAATQ